MLQFLFLGSHVQTATYKKFSDAIVGKKQIIGYYDGYYREICPHVIGLGKNDKEMCLVYQFGGDSSRGRVTNGSRHNWRCIDLSKFEISEVRTGEFHTASNHSRRQTCVKEIDVEVDY